MKKCALFFLLISIIFCCSAIADEAQTLTDGDWEYTLTEDGTAIITQYNGLETEISIPTEVNQYAEAIAS